MKEGKASLLERIKQHPESVGFKEVMSVIADNYSYSAKAFTNGKGDALITNIAGTNEGSCKIFSFAKIHHLSETETLNCFGDYYRIDVLKNPEGSDHGNIRAFIKYGWEAVVFEGEALQEKKE